MIQRTPWMGKTYGSEMLTLRFQPYMVPRNLNLASLPLQIYTEIFHISPSPRPTLASLAVGSETPRSSVAEVNSDL